MDEDAIFRRCARRLIPLITILYVVNFIDRVNVGFAALTMNRDLAFTPAVYGFGAGAFFLGYSVFQIPANLILERVGARRWIFCILAVWGVISMSNALVQGPNSFYAVRILLGFAEAGFFPGMVLYLTYWFPSSYRARLVAGFMVAIPFASAVGGPVSSAILETDGLMGLSGWQWLFLAEGAPALLLAFAVLAVLPSKPAEASWLSNEEKRIVASRLAAEAAVHRHREFWPAARDIRVLGLGLVYFGYAVGAYGVQLWLPQIVQAMGFSTLVTGFLVAIPFAVSSGAMVVWGRSSDRSGERVWHIALPAMIAFACLILASTAGNDFVIFVALSTVIVCLLMLQGPFWALPSSFLGGTAAAGGIAVVNTVGTGGGGFVGPYVLGVLKEATGGYAAGIAALAVGPAMTAILVLALARSIRPAVKQAA